MTTQEITALIGELNGLIIEQDTRAKAELQDFQRRVDVQMGVIQNGNTERLKLLGAFLCKLVAVHNNEDFNTVLARHTSAINSNKKDAAYVKAVLGD
jgi:hypothetical protein